MKCEWCGQEGKLIERPFSHGYVVKICEKCDRGFTRKQKEFGRSWENVSLWDEDVVESKEV